MKHFKPILLQMVLPIIFLAGLTDCEWGPWSDWSPCSHSCDGGTTLRVRKEEVEEEEGGAVCRGGNRQRRRCNQRRCPRRTTTTTSTTTISSQTISSSTTSTTTTSFSTTSISTVSSTTTSRITTTNTTSATLRTTTIPTLRTTTTSTTIRTTTSTIRTTTASTTIRATLTGVRCWSCGSLFATDAPDCETFNSADPAQLVTCSQGEACLYYSWSKSSRERSVIRECFPTSILLGSIDSPVRPGPECEPDSLEEDGISACLCTSDLCNGIGDDDIKTEVTLLTTTTRRPRVVTTRRPRLATTTSPPAPRGPPAPPARRAGARRVRCHQCGSLFSGSSTNPECEEFDPSEPAQQSLCAAGEVCLWYSWQPSPARTQLVRQCFSPNILLGSLDQPLTKSRLCQPRDIAGLSSSQVSACLCDSDLCNGLAGPGDKLQTSLAPRVSPTKEIEKTILEAAVFTPHQTFHPARLGLQCYSCGSLLDPDDKCDQFSRTDKRQVQTCLKDEHCLMYSWKKSPTERATVRECLPSRVVLGSLSSPLSPLPSCRSRDISQDQSGDITACLCQTDFCNDEWDVARQPEVRPGLVERKCPTGFGLVDKDCYYISTDSVGWIGARKSCEGRGARLVDLEDAGRRRSLSQYIMQETTFRRFWSSGSDVELEGDWVWAGTGARVSSSLWLERPAYSLEENCLVWILRRERSGVREGGLSGVCCNNLPYICHLDHSL